MTAKLPPTVSSLFDRWQLEDKQMHDHADNLQDWMREVALIGKFRFGETASRLQPFRELLTEHFEEEDAILDELQNFCQDSSDLAAMRRQASRDHSNLLARLDDFIVRLKQLEPPFASWQEAMEEFDLFFVQIEQHEDQERESLQAMMPNAMRNE